MKHRRFDFLDCLFSGAVIVFFISVVLFFRQPGFEVTQAHHGLWVDELIKRLYALFSCSGSVEFSGTDGFHPDFFVCRLPGTEVSLPLMSGYYTGMAVLYYMVPFVLVFGTGVFALKAGFVFAGIMTILMVKFCVQRWFGRLAGVLSGVFLAVCPVFVRSVRLGIEKEENFLVFLFWLMLFLFQFAVDRRRKIFAYLAAVVAGVGLWAKFTFWGYLGGMCICFIFYGRVFVHFLRSYGWTLKNYVLLGVCTLLGVLPFIVYNVKSGLGSVAGAFGALSHGDQTFGYVVDNRDVWSNFLIRSRQLWDMVNADLIHDGIFSIALPVLAVFFVICLSGCVFLIAGRKIRHESRRILLSIFCVYSGLFVLSIFTPSEHEPEHLVSLIPFWQITAGIFCAYGIENFRHLLRKAAIAGMCFVVVLELCSTAIYLRQAGGLQSSFEHFGRIYECRAFLKQERIEPLVYFSSTSLWSNLDYALYYDEKKPEPNRQWPEKFFLICEEGDVKEHVKGREFLKLLKADPALECLMLRSFESGDENYRWEIWQIGVKTKVDQDQLWFNLIKDEPELHVLFFAAAENSDAATHSGGTAHGFPRTRLQKILKGDIL